MGTRLGETLFINLQLSVKHDTARVIQCCLKYGSRGQRSAVFSELKGEEEPVVMTGLLPWFHVLDSICRPHC